jgi:hypothetical protein
MLVFVKSWPRPPAPLLRKANVEAAVVNRSADYVSRVQSEDALAQLGTDAMKNAALVFLLVFFLALIAAALVLWLWERELLRCWELCTKCSLFVALARINRLFTVRSGTTRAICRTMPRSWRLGLACKPLGRATKPISGVLTPCFGVTMSNRCRSLLLLSASLVVGYPAAWLLAMSSTPLSAHLAPRNGVELTFYGLAVTALAFTLTLWTLPA